MAAYVCLRDKSPAFKRSMNICAYTYDLVQHVFAAEYRGKIDAKGKGAIDVYFVIGERTDIAITKK